MKFYVGASGALLPQVLLSHARHPFHPPAFSLSMAEPEFTFINDRKTQMYRLLLI